MSVTRLAATAAFCVLAAPWASAQKAAPIPTGSAPIASQLPGTTPGWPKTLPNKEIASAKPEWSKAEVELAQARCTVLLKGLNAVVVPEVPIREGTECGAPAPVKLVSIGRTPEVALSPPPVVTCDLVAALAKWLERDVQPLARKHLGAPLIRIDTMSSYSCRNAYGRAHGRVSEHGKANAVDIASFVSARGQAAPVLAEWGPTARQIAAEAAAATKAAAAKAPEQVAAPRQPGIVTMQGSLALPSRSVPAQPPPTASALAPADQRQGLSIVIPGITLDVSRGSESSPFGLAAPSRLGGPKPPAARAEPQLAAGAKTEFLRAAHRSACRVFHTVLGPEANNAHLNHFHLDMAERIKDTRICE
jgi:hypothetical protein